ncbi:hypothetical protein J3E61_006739 [Mycobacterium sp. OAE908]
MRPRDHLVLTVSAVDCEVVVDEHEVPWLKPVEGESQSRLIVTLPPQHVLEQVYQEKQGTGPKVGQPEDPDLPAGARFSGRSRLAFTLSESDSVELTVNGILTAMSRLALAVAPLAEPRVIWHLWDVLTTPAIAEAQEPVSGVFGRAGVAAAQSAVDRVRATRTLTAAGLGEKVVALEPVARQAIVAIPASERARAIDGIAAAGLRPGVDVGRVPIYIGRPSPRPPTQSETALEVPSRLQLSPSERGAWAHAIDVDDAPGVAVELWNTRLGVRAGSTDAPTVDEVSADQRIVRAVWTRDLEQEIELPSWIELPPWPFRASLTRTNRIDIVNLSTGDAGSPWLLPAPAPVEVNKLALTSLGAFMDVRGHWDVKGVPLTEWQHRTTLGRDQFVRVVEKGYFCPFGHRAVYITETRRRADPTLPDGGFAILWQRHYIILRERVRSYSDRGMPGVQVTIDPKVTPDINDPGQDAFVFWPTIGTKEFAFTITVVDQDGSEHKYHAPLLFVLERRAEAPDKGRPTKHEVYEKYALTDDGRHHITGTPYEQLVRHDLGGKRIAIAPTAASGEATYETRTLRFTADLADDTCTPSMLFGEFVIPAVAAATGRKDSLPLSYADAYVQHGFSPADNKGEVVLVNAENAPPAALTFDSSDRSGGFLKPSQHIAGIARGSGPVSDVAAATTGAPADPSALFAGIGKLLGLFELADILDDLGLDDIPAYTAQLLDIVGAITGGISRAADFLGANPVGGQLDAAGAGLDALIHQTPAPSEGDFAAFITATLRPAVEAGRAAGVLGTLGKAEAAIVERTLATVDAVIHPPPGSPIVPAALLGSIAAGRPTASALNHVHLEWRPPIKQWPDGAPSDAIFLPPNPRSLLVAVDVRGGDLVVEPSVEVLAQLTDFRLQLLPGLPLLHIPFKRLYFRATSGAKTEIDVDLGELEWLGVLGFVDKLRELIPSDGFSDPPSVSVDTQGVSAGFSLVLPNVAVGVFNLSNMSMAADLKLPFIGDTPTVGFCFCSRERPFTVAVLFLGGGGFFGLRLSPKKMVLLEAAVEFGATLALDFGVASGSVSCMAGVYLRLQADDGSLTGYLRIRGEVDVLGLISACIEMYMGLTYEFGSGKVIGRATITVEVEVLVFSGSVSISAERKFAGSKGDPTFADALGPYVEPECPWINYCRAFAEV